MATRKATDGRAPARPRARRQPEPERTVPVDAEVLDAIERWRAATHVAQVAREHEEEARRVMVDVFHRLGIKGLVL